MIAAERKAPSSPTSDNLCLAEAARLLGLSRSTVRQWVRSKLLPSHSLPLARGQGAAFRPVLIQLADLIAFAQLHNHVTPAIQAAADKHGIGLRPPTILVLTTDAALLLAVTRGGYDVTPATDGFQAGQRLGRKRFDAALLDSAADGWRSVWDHLAFHALWMATGLLTPEDQPPKRNHPFCWQKPVDGGRVAAELLENLRARR